jgi:hypothetical protein
MPFYSSLKSIDRNLQFRLPFSKFQIRAFLRFRQRILAVAIYSSVRKDILQLGRINTKEFRIK